MNKHTIILWGGVVVFVIASVLVFVLWGGTSGDSGSNTPSGQLKPVTESDWVRGDIHAKVIIVEYSDFQCPACAAYYSIIKQLEEKFGSRIGFVYRHFPLFQRHPNAKLAAAAAEAAGRQNKFWEMHDLLFENQSTWAGDSRAEIIFVDYARTLQLDGKQFADDLHSSDIQEKISSGYEEAVSLGLPGTPSFFFNGRELSLPLPYKTLEGLISSTLNP